MELDNRPLYKAGEHSLFDRNALKVVLIGCIAIVTALLFMSITSMVIIRNAVVSKLKTNDLGNLAESIGAVIESKIDKAVDMSISLANDSILKNWVEGAEKDNELGGLVKARMAEMVEEQGYDTSFVVNASTRHYWSYNSGRFVLLDTVSRQDADDNWFFATLGRGEKYEINIDHNKELGDTFVWINTLAGDLKSPSAVTGLGMNLSEVIDELISDETKNSVKNDIWLVDGGGTIYLSKQATFIGRSMREFLPEGLFDKVNSYAKAGRQFEITEYSNRENILYDLAFKKIKSTDWKLIVQIPRSESTGFLRKVSVNTIISCILIIMLMVATFFLVSNRIANPYKRALELNRKLEKLVEERTGELQEKNTKITDSIDYAKMIQKSIFPSDQELSSFFKEYFTIFEPKDVVGGDFYWIRSYSDGFILVAGDCTGHGVPGALMTTAVNAMLNHIAEGDNIKNPSEFLTELDRLFKKSFARDGKEGLITDGLDAVVLYAAEGRLQFAGANLPIYIYNMGKVKEIKGNNMTIDCVDRGRQKIFDTVELDHKPENIYYIVTDGYVDQAGGEKKLPYGKRRLLDLLSEAGSLDVESQKDVIEQELARYQGQEARRDDITFLCFRFMFTEGACKDKPLISD